MTPQELQAALLRRAESLHYYIESRIPKRYRSIVSPEDVLQEVWITAYQTFSGDIRDVDRWLTTVANSKVIDALRTVLAVKRGGGRAEISERPGRTSSSDSLFARVHGDALTPSRDVSTQEARHAVQVALASLPHDARRAVQLRYIEGLSHQAIAKLMRRSKPAVNSLLFRGLRELRGRIGQATLFFSDARSSDEPGQNTATASQPEDSR
ncbi:MAG: RNA polymerase sigma factor [Phycisphaerae bacterium]